MYIPTEGKGYSISSTNTPYRLYKKEQKFWYTIKRWLRGKGCYKGTSVVYSIHETKREEWVSHSIVLSG